MPKFSSRLKCFGRGEIFSCRSTFSPTDHFPINEIHFWRFHPFFIVKAISLTIPRFTPNIDFSSMLPTIRPPNFLGYYTLPPLLKVSSSKLQITHTRLRYHMLKRIFPPNHENQQPIRIVIQLNSNWQQIHLSQANRFSILITHHASAALLWYFKSIFPQVIYLDHNSN